MLLNNHMIRSKGIYQKVGAEIRILPDHLIQEINFLEEKEYNFKLGKHYNKPIVDNNQRTKLAKT